MKEKIPKTYAHYLPVEADALRWGLHVVDCGFTEIPPGSEYPPEMGGHPKEYRFSWESGRLLNEYQLVYITKGRGTFESKPTGRARIEAGHAFIIFPGVWHRYQPLKSVGWDETWIGFSGEYADRIMKEFFPTNKAIIRIGYNESLLLHMRAISELMEAAPPGYQQLLAAKTTDALARVRSLTLGYSNSDTDIMNTIQKARYHLLTHSNEDIDMPALAKQLGMSYSGFRITFKAQTGMAPHQYQLHIRINKACELLTNTKQNITEISDHLGFSSVYYFSRIFKQKTELSPLKWRAKHTATPPH